MAEPPGRRISSTRSRTITSVGDFRERAVDIVEAPLGSHRYRLAVAADTRGTRDVGVPPGARARMVITARRAGRSLTLFAEGWPDRNREGRPIGLQRVTLMLHDGRLQVIENDSVVYESAQPVVFFDTAHVSFRLESHSNYPRRTVHFGPVRFERLEQ